MTVSPEISLQHRMSLLGGFNTLALQWGMGTLSSLNAYPADNASSGAWQWRIVEWLVFEPIPQLSGMFVFTYQDKNKVYENPTPNAGNASGVNWAGDSSRSWTLGVRPVWNVMNYFKLQADLGYQSVTPKVAYASGGPYSNTDTRTMFKAAIAPTFAPLPGPGGSFFVRPELRVFMAWATWNDAAQAAGAMGQGSCAATNTSGSVFGCSTNGFTFGAQVEAWW
jgi:maltoporin